MVRKCFLAVKFVRENVVAVVPPAVGALMVLNNVPRVPAVAVSARAALSDPEVPAIVIVAVSGEPA